MSEFVAALEAELTARLGIPAQPHAIDSLYFGGGTPSHLGPDGVATLVALLRRYFIWDSSAEVTLEANPDDVTTLGIAAWRRAGITRVSLGAQSFDDDVLAWMHRTHKAAEIHAAVERLRDGGFASWSFDLIFALPASLRRDWERDLGLALDKSPPHLSLYGLTVEAGTPLGRWTDRGEVTPAEELTYESEFLRAHDAACAAGYDHYEVSNFAQPGHHAVHNRAYWHGVPYFGFGPAAHGFDGRIRRWNVAAYAAWRDRATGGADPVAGEEVLGTEERRLEAVYLGLRTTGGLDLSEVESERVAPWVTAGWGRLEDRHLTLTPLGWLRLDSLAASLTAARGDN